MEKIELTKSQLADLIQESTGNDRGFRPNTLKYIDEYLDKQLILHPVILSDQQKKEEYDKGFCDGHNAGCEQIMDSSI